MFTTDSGYGWQAHPETTGTVRLGDRTVTLSHRGIGRLAERLATGEPIEAAIHNVLYKDRDFGHDVIGWWHYRGKRNPWRMIGRVQICRTIEHGKAHYTATSLITDHCSTTLVDLLGRLIRMQFGAAKHERQKSKRRPRRTVSESEVWARRAEEGWGPGGY